MRTVNENSIRKLCMYGTMYTSTRLPIDVHRVLMNYNILFLNICRAVQIPRISLFPTIDERLILVVPLQAPAALTLSPTCPSTT